MSMPSGASGVGSTGSSGLLIKSIESIESNCFVKSDPSNQSINKVNRSIDNSFAGTQNLDDELQDITKFEHFFNDGQPSPSITAYLDANDARSLDSQRKEFDDILAAKVHQLVTSENKLIFLIYRFLQDAQSANKRKRKLSDDEEKDDLATILDLLK